MRTVCVLCCRFELYVKIVSQGLEKLEERHQEKSDVQRTGNAAADAAEMGEKHCIVIGRLTVLCYQIKNHSFLTYSLPKICILSIDACPGMWRRIYWLIFIVPSLIRHSHFTFAEFHRRNVIRDACKAVGSLSESCFDIRFNPDVCSTGNNHTLIMLSPIIH